MREIIGLIFLIIGITYLVRRSLKNNASTNSTEKLIKNIINDPSYANTVSELLNCIYGKFPKTEFDDFFTKLIQIPEKQAIGKYLIFKIFIVNENKFLCITNCADLDYNIGISGKMRDFKMVYSMNFAIELNSDKMQYEFYSELFDDLNDKNLKTEFKDELIKYLKT